MKIRTTQLAVMALVSGMAMSAMAQEARKTYIVQLADQPVASYDGSVAGLPATKPSAGTQLDVSAADVQAYISYLDSKQNLVIGEIDRSKVLYDYKVVFNGFAAQLTDAEVRKLKKNAGVLAITANEARHLDTTYTSAFLGLDKPGGLWEQLGGKGAAGEDIVIGVVDSGLWPEQLSFADRVDANGVPTHDPAGTQVYGPAPASWKGSCDLGEGFTAANCNNKLIGAQYFNTGFLATGRSLHWTDFVSPRDSVAGANGHGGHGSHTASTSGGNANVPAVMAGANVGKMSGVAPRARIAAYKVCWTWTNPVADDGTGSQNNCFTDDSVAAIEKAVKDGVNVINFSISGSQNSVTDPVELAFFNASNAGVFVAASAGNSGPGNQVAHVSPWIATVGASTHNRFMGAAATLGNGASYTGASMNSSALPATATIRASEAGVAGADATKLRLCYGASDGTVVLDPAKVAGKVVVCDRGTTARVNKSLAVAQAGGVGMIMADNGAGLAADPHVIPTVHVTAADGNAIKAYVTGNAAATAAIGTFSIGASAAPAPVMAGFSSRGPNKGYPNILKPDMTAPGVDIIAAVTADLSQAERDAVAAGGASPRADTEAYQGTSMSSPHVAGAAALMKQRHPTWSPAAIKSALMTTATPTFNDGVGGLSNGRLPFAQGAGHIAPTSAADPGLVYDAGILDYARYLCGVNAGVFKPSTCSAVGSIRDYNLNLPSLTAASILGKVTLTRTVKNVGDASATYTPTVSMTGFDVAVSPASLTVPAGGKASYTVTLTRTTAPLDAYAFGSLVWSDGVHAVKSPIVAKGVAVAAPSSVSSELATGAKAFTIGTGFSGAFSSAKAGLKPATRSDLSVGIAQVPVDTVAQITEACLAGDPGVKRVDVVVPANTLVARFATFDVETTGGGGNDLDILVLNGANAAVGGSLNGGSNETATLMNPAAGNYKVCVIGYGTENGISNVDFTLSSWVVSTADTGGAFKVGLPATAYFSGTASVLTSWSGLPLGHKYLGAVNYIVGGVRQGATLVEVDTTDPLPLPTVARPVSRQAAAQ